MAELDDSSLERLKLMIGFVDESVGIDHLVNCLADGTSAGGDGVIRCYVGFEPSGKAHIGWKVISLQMKRMLDSGANVLIFLADWHAWVNDKFSGVMEDIQTTATYMEETFRALLGNPPEGEGPGELRFLWASSIMDSGDYWARVLRCSKNMSLSRVRRTFSIMGRDEDSSDHDLSAFFYPALQAADIFELEIDIALGGMDQRKAHMYMREVADRNKWIKATCMHTPMLSGLKGASGRMDSYDHKMSKSDPNNAILLHDSPKKLEKKLRKAFLEIGNDNSSVYEIIRHVILPRNGELIIEPKPEFGSPSTWENVDDLISAINSGEVHPFDAKMAVARGLADVLNPISEYFSDNNELLDSMNKITGSQ